MKVAPAVEYELSQFQRRLSRKAFGASVIIALVIFAVGFKEIAKGLVLGSLFSVLNFVIMAYVLPYQIGHTRRKATGFAMLSIFPRLGLLAIPLVIALKTDSFHWAGVAAGLFAVPLAVFIEKGIIQRYYPKRVHP